MKPGGNEPGPDGDGKCLPERPIPGDGARLGGVARPKPESVSVLCTQWRQRGILGNLEEMHELQHTHLDKLF